MPDDIASNVYTKEMLVFAPVIGSAVAITYDVGYFTGFDIGIDNAPDAGGYVRLARHGEDAVPI
jgi:hypothetical protein